MPASATASGLIAPAHLRLHAPDQLLDQHQPEHGQAEPQQVAGARPECRRRHRPKRVAEQHARDQHRADSDERIARATRAGRGRVGRTRAAGAKEHEPCAVAQRIGDVRRQRRQPATAARPDRERRRRPQRGGDQCGEQQPGARALREPDRHPHGEHQVAGERQPVAPGGSGGERACGHEDQCRQ